MSTTPGAEAIIEAFQEVPVNHRLELLLEYSESLPVLPERYENHPELLERVEECQSPVYLFVELAEDHTVNVYLTAPDEAPTTKGFASLLYSSLDGVAATSVLDFDESFVDKLGLTDLVSQLRIRGLHGMLARIKRQIREKLV
jgi:cysteine desulfuration protein SufE